MTKTSLRFMSVLLIATMVTQAHAQGARQKTFEEIVNAPLVLTEPGTERVKVTTNLRY